MLLLFHDYTSPASAIAVLRVQRLADEGLAVGFEGFDAFGIDLRAPMPLDVLAQWDELVEEAGECGLLLRRPPALPPTARAHALGDHAQSTGLGASWRATAYRAFWEEGIDLADLGALVDLAERAGLDREEARAVGADAGRVAAVRRRSAARRGNGVGGVPTILAHATLVPGLLPEEDLRALAAL